MLDEFSLEMSASRIDDHRTKDYFSEVLTSYQTGNYRSAVVMLWSVVVCDILFKLQDLKDVHGDLKAKSILDRISDEWTANPRSPQWETTLLDLVEDETELIGIPEKEALLYLQQQRHLAAHPILSTSLELHRPNRDTTRSLIRNALEFLLLKPALMSREIFTEFIEDLARGGAQLRTPSNLKRFLESKYFRRLTPAIEWSLFRSFWRITFRVVNDPPAVQNRHVNSLALDLLFERNGQHFLEKVGKESGYFSSIA